MISTKKIKKYFDKKYSNRTAKTIINEIKNQIKYETIEPSYIGSWYKGLSDETIKILIDKGYIIKRSVEHCDEFYVLIKDTDIGLPYENNISSGE